MKINTVNGMMKLLHECHFLATEMIKYFMAFDENIEVKRISIHVDYQRSDQVKAKSKEKCSQLFYTNFK